MHARHPREEQMAVWRVVLSAALQGWMQAAPYWHWSGRGDPAVKIQVCGAGGKDSEGSMPLHGLLEELLSDTTHSVV